VLRHLYTIRLDEKAPKLRDRLWLTFYAVESHTMSMSGDGHYSTPDVMEFLGDQGCGHIFGLPGNARLSAIGHPQSEDAAVRRVQSGRNKPRRFFQTGYQAKSWPRERKVIARVKATSKGSDIHFIVTNLGARGKLLYEKIYRTRGRMEKMSKDHKLYTKSDRTSCHRWKPNSSGSSRTAALTEAGAVGAAGALIIAFLGGDLRWTIFTGILSKTVKTAAMFMLLLISGFLLPSCWRALVSHRAWPTFCWDWTCRAGC
jgi:hypothetical protein